MIPQLIRSDDPRIADAIRDALASGGVILFPSDTVYGIGGNAWDDRAVAKARRLKHRPADQPFSLHLAAIDRIEPFARLDFRQRRWIERLLPGPYTLLLDADTAPTCSVKDGKAGVRVPDHPFFLRVMAEVGTPLFGSSVNRSGEPPLVGLDEMIEQFPEVDLVVEDAVRRTKPCEQPSASAILDLTSDPPVALRGALPPWLLDSAH